MTTSGTYPMMIGVCPRCGQVQSTFDLLGSSPTDLVDNVYEVFARCRQCFLASMAEVQNHANRQPPKDYGGKFINSHFDFRKWVLVVPSARKCPAYVPSGVQRIFEEAATAEATGLWDAAGAMYRKVLDAATRSRTPTPENGDASTPAWKVYKDLRLRLDWLFDRQLLDPSLRDLSSCIHQDGNDAAHDLEGIGKDEANDLGDFAELALRTMFTIPGQIAENKRRRDERRANPDNSARG